MRPFFLIVLLSLPACSVAGQAKRVSAPDDDYLLEVTQEWGRASALGELKALHTRSSDLEIRLWEGYGLFGTHALIVRRRNGRWSGQHVVVHDCRTHVPLRTYDTLSVAGKAYYDSVAVARCGEPPEELQVPHAIVSVDTLEIIPLPDSLPYEEIWEDLTRNGVLAIPPALEPRRWIIDGHHYVLEVRFEDQYRASVIPHLRSPASDVDRRVQEIYRWVREHLRPDADRR